MFFRFQIKNLYKNTALQYLLRVVSLLGKYNNSQGHESEKGAKNHSKTPREFRKKGYMEPRKWEDWCRKNALMKSQNVRGAAGVKSNHLN